MKKQTRLTRIKNILGFGLVLVILASMIVAPAKKAAAAVTGTTSVSISAPTAAVTPGTQFTFDIVINTTTPFLGWQADLHFDPAAMSFVSWTEGPFLKTYATSHGGNTTTFGPSTPATPGIVSGLGVAALGVSTGLTGTGTLCTVTMQANNVNMATDIMLPLTDTATPPNQLLIITDALSNNIPNVTSSPGHITIGTPPPPPVPDITGFTPATGKSDDIITINGTNLGAATQVTFGGTAASIVTNTDSQITATLGSGASGNVAVTNAGGTATMAGFTFIVLPVITSFTPSTGGTGASVAISGANFTGATAVTFGGTAAASFIVDSASQITAIIAGGSSGTVSVTTPSGTATLAGFVYTPIPSISSFSPTIAPAGQTVVITGVNFAGATAVTFGGIAAASFTVNSATQITAVVGTGMTGSVAVTTPVSSATKDGFVLALPPTVTAINPASAHAGDPVVITGTNLDIVSAVTFGGTPAASFTVNSATQITAIVGNGTTGALSLTSPGGTTSFPGFTYTGLVASITFFTPVTAHGTESVSIIGTNLSGATQVKFGTDAAGNGGVAGTIISNTATQIIATVDSGASGYIAVVTPLGTVTKSGFTYLPPSNTSITAVPSASQIHGGDQFTVDLNINTQTPFLGWQGQVTFDATKLQCLGITEGTFLKNYVTANGGSEYSTTPLIDNNNGIVSNISYAGLYLTNGQTGTGTLCTLTFVAIPNSSAPPQVTSAISPVNIIVGGNNGTQVDTTVVSGTLNILNPAIPDWDVNMDGVCNVLDVISVGLKWGATGPHGWIRQDVNRDGTVNILDIVVLGIHWNEKVSMSPTVTGFNPGSAKAGDTVVITGSNFSGATAVTFGGVAAQSFTVNSANQITAVVGAGASGSVSVTTANGTGSKTGFVFLAPPTITAISPTTGATGASIVISGTNLTGATTVSFGGTEAQSFTVNSATQITAIVGAGSTGMISVTTSNGTVTLAGFTYTSTNPTITSFTPLTGGTGASIVITGTNLTGATAVSFGGTAAQSFIVNSATQISAVVSSGTTGAVSVTTPNGTATLAGFTFSTTVPTITSFNPLTAAQGGSVIITGSNLTGVTAVSFGGTAAQSFVVNSATQITAVVGAGASGQISVTSPGGTATKDGFVFAVQPAISSFNPVSASNYSKVIIFGTNFTGATAVKFGGVDAISFTVDADGHITAVVAPASVSGNISVTGPGGTGSLAGFTYQTPDSTKVLTPTPSATSAAAGTQFTVDLVLNTATGFAGWGGEVDFDATKLQCVSVTEGTWLRNYVNSHSGTMFVQTPVIDNTNGVINNLSYGGLNLSVGSTGQTGQGTLCTLTFSVKAGAAGTTTIQPINIILSDVAANQINNTTINSGNIALSAGTGQAAPTITGISPTSAGAGGSVVITGTNLNGATAVSFGGIAATSFSVDSATQITAVVGAGAAGSVSVTTSGGTVTFAGFTFNSASGAAPTITSFFPSTTGTGGTVTITGTNFTGATAVKFGNTAATSFTVDSATQITAIVATGTTGAVSVTTGGGTVTQAGFTYSSTAPVVTGFTPQSGASGDTITITGTNLANSNSVKLGTQPSGTLGTAAIIISNTSTQITATVPGAGSGYLTVTTANGTANVPGFTYTGPVVTSFTPTSGDTGTTVIITGTGLQNVNSVRFGGATGAAATIANKTNTQLTVTVGNGHSGTVYVSAPGGGSSFKDGFTFVPSGAGISFTAVPSATTVAAGGTFSVALNVSDTTKAFLGWQADVSFDPNVLSVSASSPVTAGAFLDAYITAHSGTPQFFNGTVDNAGGHITGIADGALNLNTTTGLTGSGTLCTLNFTVKAGAAAGNTTITLANVMLVDDHGSPGPYNIVPSTVTNATIATGGTAGITSFSPTTATTGMSVVITGTGFTGATAVSFGGTAAASFTVNSATQITAVVGTGTTGSVNVTPATGTALTLAGFTFANLPVITSFTPTSASNFSKVIIFGSNFTGATAVKFGGVAASSFTIDTDGHITAIVASGSANGSVSVISPGGTGILTGFTYLDPNSNITLKATPSATSAAVGTQFTVDMVMNTTTGFVGWGGEVDFDPAKLECVSVTEGTWLKDYVTNNGGTPFAQNPVKDNTKGQINNLSYGAINLNSGATGQTGQGVLCTLTFKVKAGATGATTIQPVNIVLADAAANQISNATINSGSIVASAAGAPTITSISPTTAGTGVSVVITGTNLTGATAVSFGGTAASSFNVDSATQITAVVGAGNTGSVSVTTPNGTANLAGFTYSGAATVAPTITSFSPVSAKKGDSVVITGTNFNGTSIVVKFGGTRAASFTVNSATQITALVGDGDTGMVSVTTSQGTGTKEGFSFITASEIAPTITAFDPPAAGTGDSVIITGTNFNGTNIAVKFGGTSAASIKVDSPTQITAKVGGGTTGAVTVTSDQGTATKDGFTFKPGATTSAVVTTNPTTTTPVTTVTPDDSNAPPIDFPMRDLIGSDGISTDNYTQTLSQDGTGLAVTLTINKGTRLMDSLGNPITDITVNSTALPSAESDNIVPIQAYEFGPDGSTFNPAITITVPYDPAKISESSIKSLRVVYYSISNSKWEYVNCSVDTTNHLIHWQTTHFTTFAIVSTTGFRLSWSLMIYIFAGLFLLGLALFVIMQKREKLVLAFAGWRGGRQSTVADLNTSEPHVQSMPVYSSPVKVYDKSEKMANQPGDEDLVSTIEIDKGNVECNEIGLVFDENSNGSNGTGPVRIKLGYNPKLGNENVIKINLIKRSKGDE